MTAARVLGDQRGHHLDRDGGGAMTRTSPVRLGCALQDVRSMAIVLGLMGVSALAGWLLGRG